MKEEECDAMGRTPSPWVTQAISVGSLLLTTFLLVFHGCCGGGDRSLPHLPCPGPRNSLRWECSVAHGSYPLSSTSHKMTFTWSQAGGPPLQRHQPLSSDHKCILFPGTNKFSIQAHSEPPNPGEEICVPLLQKYFSMFIPMFKMFRKRKAIWYL